MLKTPPTKKQKRLIESEKRLKITTRETKKMDLTATFTLQFF